jgi:hypothetical protein
MREETGAEYTSTFYLEPQWHAPMFPESQVFSRLFTLIGVLLQLNLQS